MMVLIVCLLVVLMASAGFGAQLRQYFPKLKEEYFFPLGFALLLMILQLVYYPAMFFHWSSTYEHVVSLLVLLVGCGLTIRHICLIKQELWRKRSCWLLLSFGVFLLVFYHSSIEIAYSDSQMYLNYMSQNVHASKINLFHIWTGQWGKEWDSIYLFQAYYHFGSFLSWLVNQLGSLEFITIQTWGLGILYSLTSAGFLVNFAYRLGKDFFRTSLLCLFGLLYLNFYYWRVAFAFYGNTFRTMYIAAHLYYLYLYFKEDEKYKWLCVILSFAGIATSSSYLFIAFAMNYALMTFLFWYKGKGSIAEMADFVLPMVLYAFALFSRGNFWIAVLLGLLAIIYYVFRKQSFMLRWIEKWEVFLQKHSFTIFLFGAAVLLAIGGAIYYFVLNPHYEYNYRHYFQNHQLYDMIKDYFFVYSGKTQKVLNLLRWGAVILLLLSKREDNYVLFAKKYIWVLLLVFLSPLSTVAIAKLMASNVYYRTFDALFNPFTEMLLFMIWLDRCVSTRQGKMLVVCVVVYLLVYAHLFSFLNAYAGEYGQYVHQAILPKYKLDYESYDAAKYFTQEIKQQASKEDGQWRVISHVEGLRTFVPDVWQIFTLREYYYANERINAEFYEQARNHYSYETYLPTDFSSACQYVKRFAVDYLLIEYHNNPDFDIEIAKCSQQIYENSRFRIYRYLSEFEAQN